MLNIEICLTNLKDFYLLYHISIIYDFLEVCGLNEHGFNEFINLFPQFKYVNINNKYAGLIYV